MNETFMALRDFMHTFFGPYVPISYTDATGTNVVPAGLAGVDLEYVLSVCVFSLVVYSLFRLLGILFQGK